MCFYYACMFAHKYFFLDTNGILWEKGGHTLSAPGSKHAHII